MKNFKRPWYLHQRIFKKRIEPIAFVHHLHRLIFGVAIIWLPLLFLASAHAQERAGEALTSTGPVPSPKVSFPQSPDKKGGSHFPDPEAPARVETPESQPTLESLAREVVDPSTRLTLLTCKNQFFEKFYGLKGTGYQFLFQPIITTDNFPFLVWRSTVRPTIPVMVQPDGIHGQVRGLGDVQFNQINFFVDNKWVALGLGPTFIFPTASHELLGQGKWQIGPAALVVYRGSTKFKAGALIQNWTSFAGERDRPSANLFSLQPFVALIFKEGWYLRSAPILTCDWHNSDKWTVPINLGVGKVVKLGRIPFSISVEPEYVISHPQKGGEQFLLRLFFTPIIPGY